MTDKWDEWQQKLNELQELEKGIATQSDDDANTAAMIIEQLVLLLERSGSQAEILAQLGELGTNIRESLTSQPPPPVATNSAKAIAQHEVIAAVKKSSHKIDEATVELLRNLQSWNDTNDLDGK